MTSPWRVTELLAKAGGVAALATFVLFRVLWRRGGTARAAALRAALALNSTLLLFLALEAWFAGCHVRSDGYGATLAGRRWFEEHWRPINSLGYRDHEHEWGDRKVLLVVGDSFVAGHGIDDIDDRMSGVLQRELGPDWRVAAVAQCGWDPLQEYDALVAHPRVPDRIVVSYYINDIESAAKAHGNAPPTQLLEPPPASIEKLVSRSYFVNWLYWRVVRGRFGTTYWDWLKLAYEDPAVLATHAAELERFIAHARAIEAQITFVVWPNLDYLAGSRPYTDRIVRLLEERNVPVLDLGARFDGRDSSDLVVNPMDGHPNPATHAQVARWLLEMW